MDASLKSLESTIKEFRSFRQDLEENKIFMKEKQKELVLNQLLIKKEIFDLADTMDILAQVIRFNYSKLTQLQESVVVS